MCGIIGVKSEKISKSLFESARDSIAHRGPDDAGYFSDPKRNIQLGHRRLSIIDLSIAGHQPMKSSDGRYLIIFNGEIYNYIELKEELKNQYQFETQTDTEVLLAAFIKWGEACLNNLNGMFAFCIYDTFTGELFCARDRLGEKPFYYYVQNGEFYFASEIKALLALGIKKEPNDYIIYDYLVFGAYDHTDETFFSNVQKLPAGCFLRFSSKNQLSVKRYWDLNKSTFDYESATYEELQSNFRVLLEDSIRLRFRSDVLVGLNISSGIDSNSLLFFSEKILGLTPRLFSMCMQDEEYDECKFIVNTLTQSQKKEWHTSFLKPEETFDLAEKMNAIQDEPYGGIPTIAYYKLCAQAMNNNITVLLEGQGADEILAGYHYYTVEYIQDLIKSHKWRELFAHANMLHKTSSWFYSIFNTFMASWTNTHSRSQDLTSQVAEQIISSDFLTKYKHSNKALHKSKFKNKLLDAQYRDIFFTKLPRVLRFNDHATMSLGKELRLPYLDHRIVEFCFFLPYKYKIIPGEQKRLLRDSMANIMPPEINLRKKIPFGAVQSLWMRNYLKNEIKRRLNSSVFKNLAYFNHKKLQEELDYFFMGKGNNSFFLWQCLNLEMWFHKYIF